MLFCFCFFFAFYVTGIINVAQINFKQNTLELKKCMMHLLNLLISNKLLCEKGRLLLGKEMHLSLKKNLLQGSLKTPSPHLFLFKKIFNLPVLIRIPLQCTLLITQNTSVRDCHFNQESQGDISCFFVTNARLKLAKKLSKN